MSEYQEVEMIDVICHGCGALVGRNGSCPEPKHCGECPPWRCENCGAMDGINSPCLCWVDLRGMALPDLKYYMALGGMGVEAPGTTGPHDMGWK